MKEKIQWPVIRFTEPSGIIISCRDEQELFSARFIGLPDLEKLKSIYIVDAKSNRFDLSKPRAIGVGGLKRLTAKIWNPRVSIDYDIKEIGPVSIDFVREALLQNMKRYKDYFWEMGSPEEFEDHLNKCNTVAKIVEWLP
jgi:hypothetical protein